MMQWLASDFQHTEKPKETVLYQNGLKAVKNGGRGWI